MPVTIPRNEEMAKRARKLYVPGVVTYARIAEILGCSITTVARYVNPAYAENNRRLSLEAKRRRTGTCQRCGGETRYNGHALAVSTLCASCNTAKHTHCKNGHLLIPENRVKLKKGDVCRLCRNKWARDYSRRARRLRGIPEYGEYKRPKEDALLARLETEEAPT